MGIHQQWKLLLKEHYPQCFLTQYPEEKKLDVFAIDFLPFIFGKSQNINTGQHFMNYVFKTLRDFFDQGGHTCIIAIDSLKYVPLAKAPTQMDRDKYSKPLPREELGDKVMGSGLLHQEWHRVMANRELREKIFEYFEQEFLTSFFKRVKKETWSHWTAQQRNKSHNWLKSIVIDGGRCRGGNPYVIYSTGEVVEMPEWRTHIGESDLKIPYYIHYVFPDESFLVQSIDSDLIRILLGGTCLRLDPSTGQPRSQVYLRLNDAKKTVVSEEEAISSEDNQQEKLQKRKTKVANETIKNEGEVADRSVNEREQKFYYERDYVDINALWAAICEHWARNSPSISNPIANELVLMTLGGDDFVKNLPNCGAKVLHEVYLQNAEQIGELVTLSGHTLDSLAQVDLHLEALWELVRYVYRNKLKSYLESATDLPTYEALRTVSIDNLKRQALHCLPSEEIQIKFRQVRWTLLYLLNGYKPNRGGNESKGGQLAGLLIPDCLEEDGEGHSLHGWQLKNAQDGINRKNIIQATSISPQIGYQLLADKEGVIATLHKGKEELTATKPEVPFSRLLVDLAFFSLPLLLFASVTLYQAWRLH
jgi:hypothetical protein